MKFLVIKPRGEFKIVHTPKQFEEYDVRHVQSYKTFIQQQVGKEAVERVVGDYLFWISKPDTEVPVEKEVITIPAQTNLVSNLFVNETEIAFGNVVVTANARVMESQFEGLTDQDIGTIMNAFTNSNSVLVEDQKTKKVVAVDKLFHALLSPNGYNPEAEILPTPKIPDYGNDLEDLSK